MEDLYLIINQVQQEIRSRTDIARNMIPSDVWMRIFQLDFLKEDISSMVSLKSVCKRWNNIFIDFPINEATIRDSKSIVYLKSLPYLQTLNIDTRQNGDFYHFPASYFEKYLTNLSALTFKHDPTVRIIKRKSSEIGSLFKNLKNFKSIECRFASELLMDMSTQPSETLVSFPNLFFFQSIKETIQKLKLYKIESLDIDNFFDLLNSFKNLKILYIKKIGTIKDSSKIQTYFSNHLSNFESIKFPKIEYINCYDAQKNNPNIRFCWYFNDQEKYEGEFNKKNKKHGIGTLTFCSKKYNYRYVGEFKNDKKEGKGILTRPEGISYDGEWKGDLKEGKGILIDLDGRYEAKWLKDMKHGIGTWVQNDGTRYEGEWKSGCMSGNGKYLDVDGNIYEGEFEANTFNGYGVCHFKNGSKYEGEWYFGDMEGKGIYTYSDGSRYEGEFGASYINEDIGVFIHSDGRISGVNEMMDEKLLEEMTFHNLSF